MQYLIYPTKKMNITQNYDGAYTHYDESHGNPKAYPIDENCGSPLRDYFYAPCDVIVKRVYGVGASGTNTIWLESTKKVKLANGKESYVTIRVTHPNDDTLKGIKIGQQYKQKSKIFKEGKDGRATGNHFHIEVSTCKFVDLDSNGWKKNDRGVWVTTPNAIKPELAFYVDTSFTKIIGSGNLSFKALPNVKTIEYYKQYKGKSNSLVDALNSLKIDYSFSNRRKIAKINGVKGVYLGLSSQNIYLLNLLKEGKLIKSISK